MINQNSQTSNHLRNAAGIAAPRQSTPNAIRNAKQSDRQTSTSETLRRASIACVACRDRRIKCDGDAGQRGERCSNCGTTNRPCVYRFDDRRKRSSKAYIQTLQDRIAALEQNRHLTEAFPQGEAYISGGRAHDGAQPDANISHLGSMAPSFRGNAHLEHRTLGADFSNSDRILLNTKSITKDFGLEEIQTLNKPKNISTTGGYISVADRLGYTKSNLTEDENGQLHFFGYSSNLQIVSFLPVSPQATEISSPSQATGTELEELANSKHIKDHLIGLYFTYQHPALPILDENTFMLGYREGARSQYFSQFLLYSLLLRSLRLSKGSGVQDLGTIFLQRAKAELMAELDNPTISTIQALCIFGHYLGSLGNDRSCWLFPGMAFRLLFDLGLHQDCTELMSAGCINDNDRKVRLVTLWGCYIIDKLYSCFQGRPTAVKLADISAPLPSKETVGSQYQILSAWVDLARILDDIINIVNRQEELLGDPVTLSKLSVTGDKLLQWLKRLPAELQWDPKQLDLPSPGICAIHMQFLATTILLHRPFSASVVKPKTGKPSKRQLKGYTPSISQQICTLNSMRIAKILSGFHRQFGLDKIFSWVIPVILTASLSLISDIASETQKGDKANERNWLKLCFALQKEMASSLPLAGRNLAILKSMLDCCGYPELSRLTDDNKSSDCPTSKAQMRQTNPSIVHTEKPQVVELGRETDSGILDQMEIDPSMGPQDFDFSDFFPQFMPLGFGSWTSDANTWHELNLDPGPLQDFGRQSGGVFDDNKAGFPMNY